MAPEFFSTLGGELDQLLHVGANRSSASWLRASSSCRKGASSPKSISMCPVAAAALLVKLQSVDDEPHARGLRESSLACFRRRPQIPIGFEHIGVVVVEQVGGDAAQLLPEECRARTPLENGGLSSMTLDARPT